MFEFFDRMYDIHQNIFILVAMVCIWTTLIVNRALDNLLVTIFSLPLFLHSALAAIVVLSDYRVLLAYDKTLNLVLFAGIGVIVGLFAMTIAYILSTKLIDLRSYLLRNRYAVKPFQYIRMPKA